MDHINWELEMGNIKSSGEVTFGPTEVGEPGETKAPRDRKWGELIQGIGATLVKIGEKWQEEERQEA